MQFHLLEMSRMNEQSTNILSSPSNHMELLPSSSSYPLNPITTTCLLGGSSGGGGESRAIDRHNPIITDEKRSITKTPPNSSYSSPFTPKSSPLHQQKQTRKNKNKSTSINNDQSLQIQAFTKSVSESLDLTKIDGGKGRCIVSKGGPSYVITPPESSRYMLGEGEDAGSSFVDERMSDSDPISKLKVAFDQLKRSSPSTTSKPPIPPNSSSSHQVVALEVSLHCRGCEGKVRRHLSRMKGVKSFNIEFGAKKVTVIGDVTPLQLITSISKVKNTQILMSTTA